MGKPDFSKPNGQGGQAFSSTVGEGVKEVKMSLCVHNKNTVFIESIQLTFENKSKTCRYGGTPGRHAFFHVADGDYIIKMEVKQGWGTDAIRFTTHQKDVSPWFGGTGGTQTKMYQAGPSQELVGLKGRCGSLLDNVEPRWGTRVCTSHVVCKLEPMYELAKGTGFKQTETLKYKVGVKHDTYNEQKITTFASQASAKVSWGLQTAGGNATVNTKLESAFSSASSSTSQEHEYSKTMEIDSRDYGVFLYRGIMLIHLNNGKIIEMKGSCLIGNPTALVAKEYIF